MTPALNDESTPSQSPSATATAPGGTATPPLSEAACRAIVRYLAQVAHGEGYTAVKLWSSWSGHVRWARNQISTSGEVQTNYVQLLRDLRGAGHGKIMINDTSAAALVAAARRAERLAQQEAEQPQWDTASWFALEPLEAGIPPLFDEATFGIDANRRAEAAITLAASAAAAGVLSAGYIETAAHSVAILDTLGHVRYVPYTMASYSVTVRDPMGQGSGWAGVDWPAWRKIDAPTVSQQALDKCLASRHPVTVEPGRYTAILEPQAVCDFVGQLLFGGWADSLVKDCNIATCGESETYPFYQSGWTMTEPGLSQLGEQIVDRRITISVDPRDPELSILPVTPYEYGWIDNDVYHPTTWIKEGVLTALAYRHGSNYGNHATLGVGVPNPGAFRMSGGTTSMAEMIASTTRGLLVTRLDRVDGVVRKSLLVSGYTRDGLWLIENGKISKPIKNLRFVESILFALNNIELLGVPQRVYHPVTGRLAIPQPAIVPSMKIRDFSFTALADAV
jgi:predicted Zn-dependent protease